MRTIAASKGADPPGGRAESHPWLGGNPTTDDEWRNSRQRNLKAIISSPLPFAQGGAMR